MRVFFSGPESVKDTPFLVDSQMRPVTEVNAWLRTLCRNGATSSPHTLRTYAYHIFDFFSYLESRGLSWERISDDSLLEYRDLQDGNLSPHTGAYVSRRTINARLSSVGRFYDFAFREGLIPKNPVAYKKVKIYRPADNDLLAHIRTPQVREVPSVSFERLARNRDVRWRPHAEIMRWVNSIEDWPDKLIAKLLYRLGLRREELTGLTLLELPDRSSVNPVLQEVSFLITGKGRKRRLVYMSMRDFDNLHAYIEVVRSRRVRNSPSKHHYVFVDKKGAPLKPSYVNRMFARTSERCGVHVTPHMMRHSFAVQALQHWKSIGMSHPERMLQARLGHSSVTTTEIYMHMTDEMRAQEAHGNATLIELLMKGELDEG